MAEIPGAPEITTPEERTKEREKVKDEQQKLTTSDMAEQKKLNRTQMLRNVAQQTLGSLGQPKQLVQTGMQAQQAAMQQPVQQQAAQSQAALQTLQMEGDISTAKQASRAKAFQSLAEAGIGKLALQTAMKAFDMGYDAKELALHQNAEVSDLAFQKMYEDFEAGRVSRKEILSYGRKLGEEAKRMKVQADIYLAETMGEFQELKYKDLSRRDKERILKAIEYQKNATEMAAKAANTGAILSGVFGVVGTAVGAYFGGPVGAGIGGKVGSMLGENVGDRMDERG